MVLWLVLAFIAGGLLGFLAACLLQAAGRADSLMERQAAGELVCRPEDLEWLGIPVLVCIPEAPSGERRK